MKTLHSPLPALVLAVVCGFLWCCPGATLAQSYSVSYGGNYGIEYDAPTFIYPDDQNNWEIPIGFDFQFFGDTYTHCYVSENGFITFDPFAGVGWEAQEIPDGNDPNLLIAAAWTDMDHTLRSVHYEIFGDAPYRRLAITFDLTDYCGAVYYGQIKLFESTNVIEIHTQQWAINDYPCQNTTQGIENTDGSEAYYFWGDRNANTDWYVDYWDDDVVRFTPDQVGDGGSNAYIVDQDGFWNPEYSSPYQVTIAEDGYSEEIYIGFEFEFFGHTYSSLWMAQDGFITFSPPQGTTWDPQHIPDPNDPNNLIAGFWADLDGYDCMYGYCYEYDIVGSYPDRRFLISYYLYDYCGNWVETQIKLFETSNVIEIHTYFEGNTSCSNATQGIENGDGTEAKYLPGRNRNNQWSALEDFVRFTPVVSNDAGILFNLDSYCDGEVTIQTLVKNYGGNQLDNVTINWTWNGDAQDPVYYANPIEPNGVHLVDLGVQTLVNGQTDELLVWTSQPNGESDGNPSNDSYYSQITPRMYGTFTVGGTAPDYATFADAIADLELKGVCDTVIMLVRPGTYNTSIAIGHIPNAFGENKVIFRPENGDSTSVVINHTATNSGNDYVLRFNFTFNVIWERMTLNALGTSFARVIVFENGSDENVIRNCVINGRAVSSTSVNYACIYSVSSATGNHFIGNTIKDGSYGIYRFLNFGDAHAEDLVINDNVFVNQFRAAISIPGTSGIQINRNTISSTHANAWGIEVASDNGVASICNNLISLTNGTYGIRINGYNAPDGQQAQICNNMLYMPYLFSNRGMEIQSSSKLNILHNTVHVHHNSTSNYAYYSQSNTDCNIYNNIFVNTGGGSITFINIGANQVDYNCYYGTGSTFGSYNVGSVADFTLWKSISGLDANSIFTDPMFAAPGDLHVTNNLLNARANPLFSTEYDIDGDLRDTERPDIGADEFTPEADDAAVTALLSPIAICDAEQHIRIIIANLGTDTLSEVVIAWTINGTAQSPLTLYPGLAPEGDTMHVDLGAHLFGNNPDTLRFWTEMPNGNTDSQTSNDTLQYIYRLPLSGVYTIGGTSPDFATFDAATQALKTYTICGPVTFRFRDGIYTEQVVIDSITGSSANNTITFESESGDSSTVSIQFNALISNVNYLVRLNGTDYVTFRNLGFKALNVSYANIFDLRNGITHFTLEHCELEGSTSSSALSDLITSLAFGRNEYYTIRNNRFVNGQRAVVITNSQPVSDMPRGMLIENNVFVNQRLRAINLANARELSIKNNTATTSSTSTYTGIHVETVTGDVEISGNIVTAENSGDGLNFNFSNVWLGSTGQTRIYNNMLSVNSGIGMKIWNSKFVHVYFNNTRSGGSNASNHHGCEVVSGDSIDIRNNIFVANAGMAFRNYLTTPPVLTSDYNDLFTSGSTLAQYNGASYSDLPAWQTGTGFDANSMSVDPQFVSSTDLHVLADTLNGAAIPIAGIIVDIDGDPRNALHPDIGADEIGTSEDDAGVIVLLPAMPFAHGSQDVTAVIRNYGSNTITSVDIHWSIDGIAQDPVSYAGSLESLAQDTIVLGTAFFELSVPYVLKAWTVEPNTIPDLFNANDTLLVSNLYAAVSGDITVGGSSPDVQAIQDAVTAMTLGGVLDSVRFLLRTGTYIEAVSIPHMPQVSCATPVVFASESGNAHDVIWNNTALAAPTLVLNGADGITFQAITIQTTLTAHQAVVIQNQSNCNTFEHCRIVGISGTSTSSTRALVISGSSTDNDNTFYNNHFIDGSVGLWIEGPFASETGLHIEGNTFENQYSLGLYLYQQSGAVVRRNTITTSVMPSASYTGILLSNSKGSSHIDGNSLSLIQGKGIQTIAYTGTSGAPCLIYNNFVQVGNATASYGIEVAGGTHVKLYHNTLRMGGSNAGTWGVYMYSSASTELINNNIVNTSPGVALRVWTEGELTVSDHNNLLVSGANLVHTNVGLYADLDAWQITGMDQNSMSVDPAFVNSSGPHVTSAFMNGTALPLAAVTTDIDGDPRDPVMPDIGADEFDLFADDVGILAINYPVQPFPSGVNTVFIKFSNNGQDTLVSMQVDWEVDQIPQPTYYWTGLLPSGSTYDSLDIGSYDFTPYTTHRIKVWVSNPNGMTDGLAANDTMMADGLYPGLLGIYTIGGITPDFETIGEAVDVLMQGGAAGPVTFNIRSGTYLETFTIGTFPGAGCHTPVIFQSEARDSTMVTISNLGIDNHLVTLDGADGLIFRDLTLTSVNPAFQRVIQYSNGAHCNQFLNNRIIGYQSNSSSSTDAVIYSPTSADTANVFRNNWIRFGAYGFYLFGGSGTPSGTVIENNFLDQNYFYGIYTYLEQGIRILSNRIVTSDYSIARGIELHTCQGPIQVMGNDIRTSGFAGLILSGCAGTSMSSGLIANNFISAGGTGTTYGLYVSGSQHQNVVHNNLHVYGTDGTPANTRSAIVESSASIQFLNNVSMNSGAGYAISSTNNTGFTSDYNDLYTLGAGLALWNGSDQTGLEAWQTASGQDANSISYNPQFMSSTDLHVSNILLNGAATPLSYITTDFDGDLRSAMPDIGADEFDPAVEDDAGVFAYDGPHAPFAHGVQPVEVTLKNFGINTLTSATIRWLVNGYEQTPYNWTGSLASAECAYLTIGNYNFASHQKHDLVFWTELPNGIEDNAHINDTLHINNVYPALAGTYTVGGVLPDFNVFVQLENALKYGGILDDVNFHIRNGTYSTQLLIGNFPRVSASHHVAFRSETEDSTAVTIVRNFPSSQNYTIALFDASDVSFSHLTLKTTIGRVMDISNGSKHITINNCLLQGAPATYGDFTKQIIYSGTTTEDSISILNNRFELGSYGVYLAGSGGNPEKDIVIAGNTFYNCYYRSISVQSHNRLTVDGNVIFNNTNAHEGIVLSFCTNTLSVSGNDIRLMAGGNWGISLGSVSGNTMTPMLIANNYLLVKGGGTFTHGIYQSGGSHINFYHNTLRIESTHPDSRAFTDLSSFQNIHIRNCVFANLGGGKALHTNWHPGFHTNSINYCNLYTTGSVLLTWSTTYNTHGEYQSATSQNLNGMSVDPLFLSEAYHPLQVALDGTGTPLGSVTTDIEGQLRNQTTPDIGAIEFTAVPDDIGVKLLLSPATYCGLGSNENIQIRIQNYGSNAQTGFDVAYAFNGASWTVENVGALVLPAGGTLDFTFAAPQDLSVPGMYTFALYTGLGTDMNHSNDTLRNIVVTHIPALIMPVSNMIPVDQSLNIDKPVSLSWNPAPNATAYDVYIWPSSEAQPVTPQITNLVAINTIYQNVNYGQTYSWQVVAKNICGQTQASPVLDFTVRELPDIRIEMIGAPLMAVSEQQIQIEWEVKNIGPGSTQNTLWTDAVYLSLDATLNTSFDYYLGGVQNLSALQPNTSYIQTGTFTIPQGFTGDYYVFVYADRFNGLIESNDNNNWDRTASQMQITLLPPPDLVIDQVTAPLSAFSGQSIQVQYTGRNNGTGSIPGGATWRDRIRLSDNPNTNAGGTVLSTITISGPLAIDETYNRTISVNLPNAIFGDYYIYVETDVLNQIYEFAAENNNHTRSDTIEIFLTPPPNLIVASVSVPDTLHSNRLTTFDWTVENAGGTSPVEPYWYDFVYISPSPVYNQNFLNTVTSAVRYGPLNPTATYSQAREARVPVLSQGHYYFYVYTDRYNTVFEYTFENDNITRYGPVTLVNPDIEPVITSVSTSATYGEVMPLQWRLRNNGPGNVHDRPLKYTFYLSTLPAFDQGSALLAHTINVPNVTVLAGDSLVYFTSIPVPPGLNDHYYLYIKAEANGLMYEQGDAYENNITRSAGMIDIDPGPYPDIFTTQSVVPDSVTAGSPFALLYTQINQGGANATTRGVEAVYISFDSVWNPQFAQLLTEATYSSPLTKDSSVSVPRSIFLPPSFTSNVYYLYIQSDKTNVVFEYGGESNNIHRTAPIFVKPYPPVDLAVDHVLLAQDTVFTGTIQPVTYYMQSLLNAPSRTHWNDAVYLSIDSVFQSNLDLLAASYQVNPPVLASGDSALIAVSVTIPNGIFGDYYVFAVSDAGDILEDINRQNNVDQMRTPSGDPKSIHIKLSPYADLVVSEINAPATAVAGQQFTLSYTISNIGTGTAQTWQDRIYLSTDATISNGDLLLYSGRHSTSLLHGQSVTDTVELSLAGYLSGNYYLLIRTDFLNEVYEYTGESNNTTARVIEVTSPPPSDLIVDVVVVPDTMIAGEFATISWTTKNQGSHPAQGSIREIVYLSTDAQWNVEDRVFGFTQNQLYLPPQATHTTSVTAPVTGVINQEYYALVRTDALNNVPESNEDNNISASPEPAYVDVKTLFIDSLTVDSLHTGIELYYKLVVDPSLEGQAILVSLTGDSTEAFNELFVSFNAAPTRAVHDLSNNKPLRGAQQLVIREAQLGTYYILGFGSKTGGDSQEVTLYARTLSYEILAVTPDRGSNTGSLTVVIDGSRLDSTYAVRLRDTSGFVLLADTFMIVNPEKVVARFDLRGTPVGFYSIECQIEPYYVASLEDGFEVFSGRGGDLLVNWYLSPGGSSPRNRPVKIVIDAINNGDADVEGRVIRVYSPYGNVIAASYEDLINGNTYDYLDVPVQLQSGFMGVLPPGNSAMYEVFSWLHPYPFFITDVR